jgi:hypothetical protein
MAEIKSTMELVMERAARMGRASDGELQQEDERKQGMKLAADFLDGKLDNLMTSLTDQATEQQVTIRSGMIETLLRNIFLHRDETGEERTGKAVKGILEISANTGDLSSICAAVQHILGQYNQHREQLRQQLEEQMRMQYEQMLAQQGGADVQADGMSIEQALETKINEEWSNMEAEISGQYNQALDQHKAEIREQLR